MARSKKPATRNRAAKKKLWQASLESPEVRLLIDEILDGRRAAVEGLVEKALVAIDEALSATKYLVITVGKGVSEVMECGPDHIARMSGVRELRSLCLARRAQPKEADTPSGTLTMDQLREVKKKFAA